jgi:Transposase.
MKNTCISKIQKTRMLRSIMKTMILIFFYIRGIVMNEHLPPNRMVN